MNQIEIIPVTDKAGAARVEALAREIWTEHYTPLIGPAQVEYMLEKFQSVKAIEEQIAREGFLYYLLAEADSEPSGYFAVAPEKNGLFLSKLYMRKEKRGKGHGRRAVEFAEGLARDRRLSRITLKVNRHNQASIRAYESFGFRIAAALVTDIGDGFVMDDFRMEKTVAPCPASGA